MSPVDVLMREAVLKLMIVPGKFGRDTSQLWRSYADNRVLAITTQSRPAAFASYRAWSARATSSSEVSSPFQVAIPPENVCPPGVTACHPGEHFSGLVAFGGVHEDNELFPAIAG